MCVPLDPNVTGSNLAKAMDFKGGKIPQHTFLSDGK
jgi:hypothetical protein